MKDQNEIRKKLLEGTLKVCNDSRLIVSGDYYVAVKGETFDGHDFIDDAMGKGALGVIEESELYELTREKLAKVCPKIIGITGSSGKTTTTSFVYQLLKGHFKVAKGKLNTKLGLSMDTINSMPFDCEVFVAEMGMDRMGELVDTTSLFPPDIAVITTVNETHAEKLGSIENILKAKWEIVEGMKDKGIAILNYENEYLRKQGQNSKNVKWFGLSSDLDFSPKSINMKACDIPGEHNKLNALAAIGVALELGVKLKDVEKTLARLSLEKGRLTKIEGVNGCTLLDDTYNASPASTKAALNTLKEFEGGRKVAILGDMLELGKYEEAGHTEIGKYAGEIGIDILITVGKLGKIIYDNATLENKLWIDVSTDFTELLDKEFTPQKEDVILIKGSQGARMEKITKALMRNPEEAKDLLVRQDARWQ